MSREYEYTVTQARLLHEGDIVNVAGVNYSVLLVSYRPTGKAIRAILINKEGQRLTFNWDPEEKVEVLDI